MRTGSSISGIDSIAVVSSFLQENADRIKPVKRIKWSLRIRLKQCVLQYIIFDFVHQPVSLSGLMSPLWQ
jgi:hypothetical protein